MAGLNHEPHLRKATPNTYAGWYFMVDGIEFGPLFEKAETYRRYERALCEAAMPILKTHTQGTKPMALATTPIVWKGPKTKLHVRLLNGVPMLFDDRGHMIDGQLALTVSVGAQGYVEATSKLLMNDPPVIENEGF